MSEADQPQLPRVNSIASCTMVKNLANRLLQLVSQELNKTESQALIRRNIIVPVINMMYSELYPYIISLVVTMTLIMVFSLATFLCFILYYFKK